MLTSSKKAKLLNALKSYAKKYLQGNVTELDESGTRLMINTFLTDVLGYVPITEVKTEYMIRGTYADYVIQLKDVRQFLVEVKALSFALSDKHLRQAINYGANEGIEWALLTNGKCFEFYKILFNKPIESRKVFSLDLSDQSQLKPCIEVIQYIHKDSVSNKGLNLLWNKTCALDPLNVAGLLLATPVTNFIKRTLKKKFKNKFSDEEIQASINRIIHEPIALENIKPTKIPKAKKRNTKEVISEATLTVLESQNSENYDNNPETN
ncbi:MAG: type I restriction enzyme HsdR N-terminal domain-containing protein [Sphingobacteriales bacterium]|nr:type I restriction enzyme HsdR N-terminal domain-containing protein [Sphingobacteriales bacterium]